MTDEDLERVIEKRIKPLLDDAMQKYLGIRVSEIEHDISDKLKQGTLLLLDIDTAVPFKKAKRLFKKAYIMRLAKRLFGNVSDIAKVSGIDRRSVHRIIADMKIAIPKFREELENVEYVRESAVQTMIQSTLDMYKSALHPQRFVTLYSKAPELSKDILKELPQKDLTLKQAEREFERAYFEKALEQNNHNISQTARKAGLRYETLHRKLKAMLNKSAIIS
ncbi:hypothetical protein HY490_00545 [Candidatus Woesearchaeota archaeon]|nr:hypothetical protein [Candidatus Woesearchaeota archaeon]